MDNHMKNNKVYSIAFLVGAISIILSILLTLILMNINKENLKEKIYLENERLLNIISKDFEGRILAIDRLVSRWQVEDLGEMDEFTLDARNYISHMPGLESITYVDKLYYFKWTIDLEDVFYEEEKKYVDPQKVPMLKKVKNLKKIHIHKEEGDEEYIYLYSPMYRDYEFDGFLFVKINSKEWIKTLLNISRYKEFLISLYLEDQLIYEDEEFGSIGNNSFSNYFSFKINNEVFYLYFKVTDEFLRGNKSYFPLFIGISIFCLAMLATISILLYLRETKEVWENKIIHRKLEDEIEYKKIIEEELRELSERLTLATETGNIGIWNWNMKTNEIIWNDIMYRLYKLPKSTIPTLDIWKKGISEEVLVEAERVFEKAVREKGIFDYVFKKVDEDNEIKYIHCIAKFTLTDDNEEYMVGVNWDISPIKKIEEKLRKESELQKILIDISNNYINIPLDNVDKHINEAMARLGKYVNADRVYIFEYDFENNTTSNTYEWTGTEISEHIDELQELELVDLLKDWMETHKRGHYILIPKTDELPNSSLKENLLNQKIKTILTVPMFSGSKLLGFIGFDWVNNYHKVFDNERNLLNVFSQIVVNIMLRTKSEKDLIESKTRLDLALKGTQAGLWDWHIESGVVTFNERWAEMIGYKLSELKPRIETWIEFCHPDDLEESDRLLKAHFEGRTDEYRYEARMKHRDGHWIWVFDSGKVVEWDKEGKPVRMTGTHFDITERKEAVEKIKHMATHDYLTDLPTMNLAIDRGQIANENAIRNGKSTAYIFLDLDGFKAINDNYGHDVGDKLLKEVANRMKGVIRKTDTAARIGGDEFLIILSNINEKDEVIPIAKSLLSEIIQPIFINDLMVSVGVSIGISIFPDDSNNIQELIKKADIAMYKIKKTTKNDYAFICDCK